MSTNVTTEQKELQEQITVLSAELEKQQAQAMNVEGFYKLVRKYTAVKELNATLLNEFIQKILIYELTKINGKRMQKITIIYNFIGELPEAMQEPQSA